MKIITKIYYDQKKFFLFNNFKKLGQRINAIRDFFFDISIIYLSQISYQYYQ